MLVPTLLTAAAALWICPPRVARASERMQQAAYVWQRVWTPEVRGAVEERIGAMSGVTVLAGEVAWRGDEPVLAPVRLPWRDLAGCGRPVTLAMRLGSCDGSVLRSERAREEVAGAALELAERARAEGLEPCELQLDFDAATSQMDAYRHLVRRVAERLSPLPVTITALPSWMSGRDFGALVRSVPRFVLQVHSIEKSRLDGPEPSICDADQARRWAERAAAFGVPFDVALPTYGYLVVRGAAGRVTGLVAEANDDRLSGAASLQRVSADPAALAALVRDWSLDRPACMRGVVWYRLPVEGDRLNWSWPTLASVMAGRAPAGAIRLDAERREPGLVEIVARNDGDGDGKVPARLDARWPSATTLVGSDGLNGMQSLGSGPGVATFVVAGDGGATLRPGERRRIAWMRFQADTEVRIDEAR